MIEVRTAGKLGYCSGVSQAIEKAIEYGDKNGQVYSLGTVAHNEDVVELLRKHGVEPIKPEDMVPGTCVIITAHGAPPELYEKINKLRCASLDCTCPIVKKAQEVVVELAGAEFDIVIFGDPDHQEVKGLKGWAAGKAKFVGGFNGLFTPGQDIRQLGLGKMVGVVSQTTKVPSDYGDFISTLACNHIGEVQELRIFNTICPIVATRVDDTRKLAGEVDMMFVVGSKESANTKNLATVAKRAMSQRAPDFGAQDVFTIQNEDQVETALAEWFWHRDVPSLTVGVTAGTSTPVEVVNKVVARLKESLHES